MRSTPPSLTGAGTSGGEGSAEEPKLKERKKPEKEGKRSLRRREMRADPQASAIFWVAAFSARMIFSFKAPWATSPPPRASRDPRRLRPRISSQTLGRTEGSSGGPSMDLPSTRRRGLPRSPRLSCSSPGARGHGRHRKSPFLRHGRSHISPKGSEPPFREDPLHLCLHELSKILVPYLSAAPVGLVGAGSPARPLKDVPLFKEEGLLANLDSFEPL